MKKIISLYPFFALLILLISITYTPTTLCDTYRANTQCYDGGHRVFYELGKNQDDNYNYYVISLKKEVYIIQIVISLVTLLGMHLILNKKK
jgi:hypothetical protein